MTDQTTMTMSVPDGKGGMIETGPFTTDDLKQVLSQIQQDGGVDELVALAAETIIETQKASTSHIQRKLAIGYNRAARIMESLEELGVVTSADHVGQREVVMTEVPNDLRMAAAQSAAMKGAKAPPMKNTPEDDAVAEGVYRATANELRQFVERFERLDAEKKDIAEQQKEVMAEAKSRGYDTKCIRKVIALRKRDKDDIAEEEAVLEMYKEALGM